MTPSHIKLVPRAEPALPALIVIQPTRVLFCDMCGTWTPHAAAKVKGQRLYVCGCGTEILHFIVAKPTEPQS
jgi:hypothetical protein